MPTSLPLTSGELLPEKKMVDFFQIYTKTMVAPNCQRKPQQKQKPHVETKNKMPHGKTENLTAKPKTSRQNQILHSKSKIALVLPWVFAFAVRYLVFAVKYLVLP